VPPATKFSVRDEVPAEHGHTHQHDHVHQHAHGRGHAAAVAPDRHTHAHRSLPEIYKLIDGSSLSAPSKDRAKQLFTRLGEAEAAIHGTPLDKVHLHEVGALDSIIDIVGAVHALDMLKVDRVVASPLNVGSGSVRSAHGTYPVPAPATAWLLRDAPIYAGPQQSELVTPTGALIVTGYATSYGPVPAMRLKKIGYGAGTRDFHDTPNVLRVFLGEADSTAPAHTVVVVEAEIDDMNPQIFGVLMEQLLAEGALDVFYTPIQMKKNRPGTLLTLIASPDARERLTATIFRETTTIGVRYREMLRECLDRETVIVETPLGSVRFKIARRNGEVLNASAEFEDCARIAREHHVPLKDVQAAAMKAFLDRTP
jgi:pyridinium-3,5-bisthiocarboxylic acid mononucleotide nickel chelatase